ncbi:MAG: Ig-like domain-containing protein, partial [Treponema sp.]|nr:Ig-like domain-containing protein [Treponema sp.]
DKTVTWSSDNTDAATVDSAGVVTAVAEGSATITATAGGKSATCAVTVEQSAKPAATVTTAPTGAAIVGVGKTTALVSGGAADGGTLMYAVTTTNTKPTSTDGFSATVPTAQTITASGKVYVWYFVKADDTHTDSEIAATAIEVPVADIVWDATNISDLRVSGTYQSYEKEGVKLSANADMIDATWHGYGDPTHDGISFDMNESGGFTFTAPTGKAFTKIEMKPQGLAGWDFANLGSGWAFDIDWENMIYTVTWTGSAASTVGLLTGANQFNGEYVKYIAFYLSE